MKKNIKHKLPAYSILEHLSLNDDMLRQLQACVKELDSEFVSVLEANKNLCGIHHQLAKDVYDNFFQVALTESGSSKDVSMDICEDNFKEIHEGSATQSLRRKKYLSSQQDSSFNELSYSKKTPIYKKYQETFDRILEPVKGKPTRIRLMRLAAGSNVPPHIDYDPSYAVRIIIPIFSPSECVNLFWVKNELQMQSFKPGRAYFLNTGYRHAVENRSNEDRYTMTITIDGTDDIEHIISSGT